MGASLDLLLLHGRLAGALMVTLGCVILLPLRIRQAAGSRQPALWNLSLAITAIATSMGLQIAAAGIDAATGVPNMGRLLSNCTALVAVCALRVIMLHVAYGPGTIRHRVRRHYAILAAVLVAAGALFLATPLDPASSIANPRHETTVYSSPYVYLYLAYLAIMLVLSAGTAYRHFRRATGLIKVSVAFTYTACGFAIAYCTAKLAYLLGHDLHITIPGNEAIVARPLYMLAAGTGVAAAAAPVLGQPVRALRAWSAHYRTYQRLFPLWLALSPTAAPAVLRAPRSRLASLLTVRNLPFLIYRRVIEIRDRQLALRAYRPVGPAGGEVHHPWYTPTHEAVEIIAALAAQAAGRPARRVPDDRAVTPDERPAIGRADLAAEVAWLERVARAYQRLSGSCGFAIQR